MKDIFSYNLNTIEKNAYMNWQTQNVDNTHNMNWQIQNIDNIHNMIVIAEGFSDSALLLVKDILKDNTDKKADNLIFPILFNTNHSIELYLKAICWTQNELLDKAETFTSNHNLKELLAKVINLGNELDNINDKAVFYEMLSNLEAYINELYEKIKKEIKDKKGNDKNIYDITFCRYTLTNKLEPHFYTNTLDNVVVDLENFLTVFAGIFDNLQALSAYYSNLLKIKQEHE